MNTSRITISVVLIIGCAMWYAFGNRNEARAQSAYDVFATTTPKATMTASELRTIVSSGAGVSVSAKGLTASELRTIARAASPKSFVIIKDAGRLTASECRTIGSAAEGFVILDF
jgi:hypothetical protein